MVTHIHEPEPADVPELSGLVLVIAMVMLAGALVWLLT